MRILKYLIVLTILTFSSPSNAQDKNILSGVEYSNIKINNIYIDDIANTNGNVSRLNTLFGFSFTLKADDEYIIVRELWNDAKGIYIYFEDNALYTYKISNNQSTLTIKGKEITIGDHISKLGNIKIRNSNEIIYKTDYTSDILTMKFDTLTRKITLIEYESLN